MTEARRTKHQQLRKELRAQTKLARMAIDKMADVMTFCAQLQAANSKLVLENRELRATNQWFDKEPE